MNTNDWPEEPAFLDDDGPSDDIPSHARTQSLYDILAELPYDKLAAWGRLGDEERERRSQKQG